MDRLATLLQQYTILHIDVNAHNYYNHLNDAIEVETHHTFSIIDNSIVNILT